MGLDGGVILIIKYRYNMNDLKRLFVSDVLRKRVINAGFIGKEVVLGYGVSEFREHGIMYVQVIDWLREGYKMALEIHLYCGEYVVYCNRVTKNVNGNQFAQRFVFDPIDEVYDYYEGLDIGIDKCLKIIESKK